MARAYMLSVAIVATVGSQLLAAAPASPVVVRVYDTLPSNVRRAALATAGSVLAPAVDSIVWRECAAQARAPDRCLDPPDDDELVVRIGRGPMSTDARRPLPLGTALIETGSGTGVLATVYIDWVTNLARATGIDVATLLGYAIAHEIGHLLLGSTRHAEQGLMRPLWTHAELRRRDAGDWSFTPDDIAAIRARAQVASRRVAEQPGQTGLGLPF